MHGKQVQVFISLHRYAVMIWMCMAGMTARELRFRIRRWSLIVVLPVRGPLNKLFPISANVLGAEASNAAQFVVLNFDGEVRLAHQRLPEQINAVPDMARRRMMRKCGFIQLRSTLRNVEESPVRVAKTILYKSVHVTCGLRDTHKAVQLMEYGKCGSVGGKLGVLEEAALCRE